MFPLEKMSHEEFEKHVLAFCSVNLAWTVSPAFSACTDPAPATTITIDSAG